jgi:hypothetical protein
VVDGRAQGRSYTRARWRGPSAKLSIAARRSTSEHAFCRSGLARDRDGWGLYERLSQGVDGGRAQGRSYTRARYCGLWAKLSIPHEGEPRSTPFVGAGLPATVTVGACMNVFRRAWMAVAPKGASTHEHVTGGFGRSSPLPREGVPWSTLLVGAGLPATVTVGACRKVVRAGSWGQSALLVWASDGRLLCLYPRFPDPCSSRCGPRGCSCRMTPNACFGRSPRSTLGCLRAGARRSQHAARGTLHGDVQSTPLVGLGASGWEACLNQSVKRPNRTPDAACTERRCEPSGWPRQDGQGKVILWNHATHRDRTDLEV